MRLEKGFATERPQVGEKRDWEAADKDRSTYVLISDL
jgi:hypothetical protein